MDFRNLIVGLNCETEICHSITRIFLQQNHKSGATKSKIGFEFEL